jgi:hypothetical protein
MYETPDSVNSTSFKWTPNNLSDDLYYFVLDHGSEWATSPVWRLSSTTKGVSCRLPLFHMGSPAA